MPVSMSASERGAHACRGESERKRTGTLYMVATPIGHLGDITLRAMEILRSVSIVAAEDTRRSRGLLAHLDAHPRELLALHDHNESSRSRALLRRLERGEDVAVVSDAGTPLISDPGYRLVRAAHEAGIRVSPVPGPCAAMAALSVAGLPSDRFWFEGFLPPRREARRHRLQALASIPVTLIFYVPARDLVSVLEDCAGAMGGERSAALGRELTKLHETVRRATLDELTGFCRDDPDQARGEAVLLIGASEAEPLAPVDPLALARELAAELAPSRAAGVLGRLTGLKRKQAWTLIEQSRNHPANDAVEDVGPLTGDE